MKNSAPRAACWLLLTASLLLAPQVVAQSPTSTPTPPSASCRQTGDPCGQLCPDGSPMGDCFCEFACSCILHECPAPTPSVCAECPCTGDRDGDGQVTIDEIVAAVNNALNGCPPPTPTPELRWYLGCGPPIIGQNPCPANVGFCTTEQIGAPCAQPWYTCCQPGSDCTGSICNRPLICSRKAPETCPISRRRYKRDIEYLGSAARTRLRDELLAIKLATFRYKGEAAPAAPHLGFIIEDIEPSLSIDSEHDRVDLYGYLSMAVAAIQVQAAEVTALRQEIEGLRQELHR